MGKSHGKKLLSKIAELEQTNESSKNDYEARIAKLEKDNRTELKLRDAKAKNIKAVKALLDPDKDEDEQIKALKEAEETAFLFDKTNEPPKGTEPRNGGEPPKTNEPSSLADAIGKALIKKG